MRRTSLAFLLVLAACAGARGFDGTTYRSGDVAFRVPPPPPAWRRVELEGAALAFRDEPNAASVLVNARCAMKGTDVPLAALRNQLLAGTTERTFDVEEVVPMDEREALHSRLTAKLDGVPMRYGVWVLKKDGCVYDFVYVAEPERAAGEGAFDAFVRGFTTLRAGAR